MEKGQGKGTDTLTMDNDFVRRGDVKRLLENTVCLHEELPAQIDIIPAADVVPVRHGHYVGEYDGFADGNPVYDMWYCSECGCYFEEWEEKPTYNYCPNCGAKMHKDGDENV